MIKYYYQIVLDSTGQPYLDAEQQLIAEGASAVPFLQEKLKGATELARDITQVLLERISGNPSFEACLDYFEKAERRAAQTPMGTPPPESVATYLVQHFADSVAPLLGVYLIKLSPVWPEWKILGVVLYLGELANAGAADPLIRFLSTTTIEHYRNIAVQSLVAVGDASVLMKIESSLKSIDTTRQALHQATEQIRDRLRKQT